jgi:hypothetical protein
MIGCLVCGAMLPSGRGQYEICGVCDWEDDPVQAADPHFAGGANELSLVEARRVFRARVQEASRDPRAEGMVSPDDSTTNR